MLSARGQLALATVSALELMDSNALDYITARGFKSIATIEKLPLRPVNILIGSNGSGTVSYTHLDVYKRQ